MTTFTKQEAADYMHICLTSFKENVQPNIPVIRIGRRVLFDQKDLDDFMNKQKEIDE